MKCLLKLSHPVVVLLASYGSPAESVGGIFVLFPLDNAISIITRFHFQIAGKTCVNLEQVLRIKYFG